MFFQPQSTQIMKITKWLKTKKLETMGKSVKIENCKIVN